MKRILMVILMSCLAQMSFAKNNDSAPNPINLKVKFDYQQAQASPYILNSHMKFKNQDHQWKVFNGSSDQPIVLLGKIEQSDKNNVKIRFIVLNADKKSDVISAPTLITTYGKEAKMRIKDKGDMIELSVVATV
jgi:hypothetical protein